MRGNDVLSVLCVYGDGADAAVTTIFEESPVTFDVTVATTIADAVDCVESTDVDCIVSAAQLPDGDGLQFLQAIRANSPDLPFIFYAEPDSPDIASDAIAAGVTDYVVASDDAESEFAALVQHAVAQYRTDYGAMTEMNRARTVLDAAPDAIVVVVDGALAWGNPEAATLLGAISKTELYGTSLDAIAHPDDPDALSSALTAARNGGTPVELTDARIQTLDGDTATVELTAREIEWDGRSGVVAILRDVEKATTEQELQERNLKLEAILNTASAAIFAKDPDGRYLLANETFRELVDIHKERDITGITDEDLFSEEIAQQLRSADERAFEAGETVEVEEYVPAPDDPRPFLTRKTPLFDESGEPYALVAVSTDISAQKEREYELRERVKELSAVHRTVELFESGASTFEGALQEFVETLPQSFQFPERTTGRIRYGDTVAATPDFVAEGPHLHEETETAGGTTLELDIAIPDGLPRRASESGGSAGDPFLDEEINLVKTLLTVVAGYAEREEQIAELERYETTLKALGDPIYGLDRDGKLTFVNDALVERTGYGREELLGEHISKFITTAGVERGRGVIHGLLAADARATARWEMDLVTADGEHIPSENHVALLPFDEDGSFRGTAGVIRDISDQKEREQELQRSRDHLLRTEEMADVGGWELDVETSELRWTNGTRRIHEVSDDYDPTLEEALSFFHPEDRKTVEQAVRQCREDGVSFDIEVRIVTAEGRERWIQARGERVEEDGSQILRGTVQDITDSKENEQQLMVLNRVLRHNLRNNLNVVTANTELLSDAVGTLPESVDGSDQSPAEMLERLDTIEESAWELRTLAEKARQLAETIEQTDATDTVAISPLVSTLVDSYREAYPDATIELDNQEAEILGSRSAVQLAVGEIVDNALAHTDRPSPTVSIEVTSPSTDRVQIRVSDDGPGIPEMERKALEQGAETALEHGSGLGLWTVNWLSARLGGSVEIDDNEQGGAVVTLELPAG